MTFVTTTDTLTAFPKYHWRPQMPAAIRDAVEAGPVRAELARVLASFEFSRSPRLSRFLTFVVEEALAGRQESINEREIRATVFLRHDGSDNAHDAAVRVTACRLRTALVHYYQTEGRDHPIVIQVPRGTYVPSFSLRETGPGGFGTVFTHFAER